VFAAVAWAVNWSASWDVGVLPLLSQYAQASFYMALSVGVLLYPGGRLDHWVDRAWTAVAAAVLWGGPTAVWLTSRPEWSPFRPTVWWPAPFPDRAVFERVLQTVGVLYLVLAVSFAAVLLLRLPRMGWAERVVALPVTAALAFVGVSAALTQRPIMRDDIKLGDLLHVYVVQGVVVILVPIALLASGMRARFGELTVAGRMLRMNGPASVEGVRDALRDVLHDPSLDLWFWTPEDRAYVDTAGRPVSLTDEAAGGRWRRDVRTEAGEPLAVVELGAPLRAQASLVDAALEAGGRALETARLQVAVQAGLEQARAAYERLVHAESQARERLARDLHDGAQQRLLALGVMLGNLEAVADDPDVRDYAEGCRRELLAALAELRALSRGMHPALLAEDGVGPALEVAAERLGVRVRLDLPDRRFPREIEFTLYTALYEALSHTVDRARGSSVRVRVRTADRQVIAEVSDNGERDSDLASELARISERIGVLRGNVEVDGATAQGTTVRMVLPCE
jgi:signal transduction histidine kinase